MDLSPKPKLRMLPMAICCAALLFMPSYLQAKVLLRAGSGNISNLFGGASYIVDFNGTANSGGTSFTFTTSQPNTTVAILFSAECAVDGGIDKNINVDIEIDPAGSAPIVIAIPTSGGDVLCSGNGTTTATYPSYAMDGIVRTSVVAYLKVVPAGTHSLQVILNGNLALSRLYNMSMVVMD